MIKHATVDAKGRLTLGKAFANSTVLIEERDGELVIRPGVVIPAAEAWLYQNPAALALVRRGLADARAGKFVKGPNLKAAARLAQELER